MKKLIIVLLVLSLLVLTKSDMPSKAAGIGNDGVTASVISQDTKNFLIEEGIDPDYVELIQDYGLKADGKSPYARIYKDTKSDKYILESQELPMVNVNGASLDTTWTTNDGKNFTAGVNQFIATVATDKVTVIVLNDQPGGKVKKDSALSFQPQLYLNNKEVKPAVKVPILLAVDPSNQYYTNNTLVWDYGIAKRYLRLVEGKLVGSWAFDSNPNGEVRIKYNQTGDYTLELGQFQTNSDEEVVPLDAFLDPMRYFFSEYPIAINDSLTFYPGVGAVDGFARRTFSQGGGELWSDLRINDGNSSGYAAADTELLAFFPDGEGYPDKWVQIRRCIYMPDTSALPDGCTITSATFSIRGSATATVDYLGLGATFMATIVSATPDSVNAIIDSDYGQVGSTIYSTTIDYPSWITNGYNTFTFNSVGIAAISKTSNTFLGLREVTYDIDNTAPAWQAWVNRTSISGYFSSQGTGYKPKLVVVYTLPSESESKEWPFTIVHDMMVGGNTPKSQVVNSINGTRVFTLENDNGVVTAIAENKLDVLGTSTFSNNITLDGDGEIWLEFRLGLDWFTVRANGKPTHVTRGIFDGYSLPVFAADDEELIFEVCVPDRWKGPAWTKLADVGVEPGGMAVNDGLLYIPMGGDNTVWSYDGATFTNTGTVGNDPHYATTHNGKVYVSCAGDDEIWVLDDGVWALSGAVGSVPEGMVSDGTDLYVACRLDDEIWRLSGGVWAVDAALGDGGVAGAVGTSPLFMASYGGDIYVGCGGVDDDVWIRTGGAWAKDDDVGGNPQEFQVHEGDLYLNCYTDDSIWRKTGGVWAIVTNIQTDQGNAPIGLTEYNDSLFSACMGSIWSDQHTIDANAVPFWNANSDFTIVTADEPMFLTGYDGKLYCACNANDSIWVYEGETVKVCIHTWVASAQTVATDAFRLELEHAAFTCGDVIPIPGESTVREILTGIVPQFTSFCVHPPLDMTGREGDDSMGIRIRRIASSDEIAGEIVIQHIGIAFKCDKIGSLEP